MRIVGKQPFIARVCVYLICLLALCINLDAYAITLSDLSHLHARTVPIKNGVIEYYQFGSGSPIVLISGYATGVTSWNRHFLLALAQKHTVIIFNNRGVGQTAIKSSLYQTKDLAADTYGLIKALHLAKPTVFGISMGGMIAQQLAIDHPNAISTLILMNTAIAGKTSIAPNMQTENLIVHAPQGRVRRFIAGLKLLAPRGWGVPMTLSLLTEHFQPASYHLPGVDKITLLKQQALVRDWSANNAAAKQLATLSVPTLILNGGADKVIPPENSVVLAKTIPHATLLRWRHGGHIMIYQYPFAIAKTINHFIKQSR